MDTGGETMTVVDARAELTAEQTQLNEAFAGAQQRYMAVVQRAGELAAEAVRKGDVTFDEVDDDGDGTIEAEEADKRFEKFVATAKDTIELEEVEGQLAQANADAARHDALARAHHAQYQQIAAAYPHLGLTRGRLQAERDLSAAQSRQADLEGRRAELRERLGLKDEADDTADESDES
jgi:hypothetical protein